MADAHPLPWRWHLDHHGFEDRLEDAAGSFLLHPSNDSGIAVASPYIRAVTERAKAMELLLKEAVASQEGRSHKWFNWPHWSQRVESLLAEIDAATKGG